MTQKEKLLDIAITIIEEVKREFAEIHVSGQLGNSPELIETDDGYVIKIAPIEYDINEYKKTNKLEFTRDSSYASYVNDVSGGFSGEHLNFIDQAILNAIWANGCNITKGD